MGPKKLFKKIGKNIQAGGGQLVRAAGRGAGGILGAAAGKAILSGLTAAEPVAAEAAPLLLLKTGGYIRAPRNKAVPAILHGGERVLPYGVKATKYQKKVIATNKRNAKKECGCHKFVYN
jgi:hypothetical protein